MWDCVHLAYKVYDLKDKKRIKFSGLKSSKGLARHKKNPQKLWWEIHWTYFHINRIENHKLIGKLVYCWHMELSWAHRITKL